MGIAVLGHFPAYVTLSSELGASHFELSPIAWRSLGSRRARWLENKAFLDRSRLRGDRIVLATPPRAVIPGSFFFLELAYLGHLALVRGTPLRWKVAHVRV